MKYPLQREGKHCDPDKFFKNPKVVQEAPELGEWKEVDVTGKYIKKLQENETFCPKFSTLAPRAIFRVHTNLK